MRDRIKVYRKLGHYEEACSLGIVHRVNVYSVKTLHRTGMQYLYTDGYQTLMADIYTDHQGRVYKAQPPLDFHSSVGYLRDDGMLYTGRANSKPSVDFIGNTL